MRPAQGIAALLKAALPSGRAWSAAEIDAMRAKDHIRTIETDTGFAMLHLVGPEAELLTIAIDPSQQRLGQGAALLRTAMDTATQAGADTLFLEVDECNQPARALYTQFGFAEVGRRKGYYRHAEGRRSDALVLSLCLDARKTSVCGSG